MAREITKMIISHDYIRSIFGGVIAIHCVHEEKKTLLKKIGATKKFFDKNIWNLKYDESNEKELAKKLETLRDIGFYFAGSAGGWPPAAIFEYLRDKGYVSGKIIEIIWRAPNQESIFER